VESVPKATEGFESDSGRVIKLKGCVEEAENEADPIMGSVEHDDVDVEDAEAVTGSSEDITKDAVSAVGSDIDRGEVAALGDISAGSESSALVGLPRLKKL